MTQWPFHYSYSAYVTDHKRLMKKQEIGDTTVTKKFLAETLKSRNLKNVDTKGPFLKKDSHWKTYLFWFGCTLIWFWSCRPGVISSLLVLPFPCPPTATRGSHSGSADHYRPVTHLSAIICQFRSSQSFTANRTSIHALQLCPCYLHYFLGPRKGGYIQWLNQHVPCPFEVAVTLPVTRGLPYTLYIAIPEIKKVKA